MSIDNILDDVISIIGDIAAGKDDISKIIEDIKSEFATHVLTTAKAGSAGGILGIGVWRGFVSRVLQRHLATEMANTGLISDANASTMIAAGMKLQGPYVPPNLKGGLSAGSGILSNVTAWIETNLPQLLQEFITLAPLILQLIATFSAL